MIAARALIVVLSTGFLPATGWTQSSWPLPPAGYAYKPSAPCLDDPVKAEKPIRPGGAVYKVCEDQMAYLARSIEEARGEGKLLIATVGATWCPWCAALQKAMPGPEFFGHKGDPLDYAKTFKHIEIGVSTTYKGRNALIPSGDAVVKALLAKSGGVELEAIPFIFLIDPEQPDKVFARNTKDLSDFGTGAQNMAGFRKAIREGHAALAAARKKAEAR